MTQVTVNSNTYSDDGTSAKDMQNGGHRAYLLPMISDTMVDTAAKVAAAAAQVTLATTQAGNALTQANNAASSATTAANAPGTSATSTTTLTIATGAQSLTIQTGKLLQPGMPICIANTAAPANWMAGNVTSYSSGTGALVANITNIAGSATGVSTWTVSLVGVPGVSGVVNEIKAVNIASAATVNLDAATGNLVHITGTTGITAFTLAAGSRRTVVFDGILSITNSASVVCPGNLNITTAVGDMCTMYGDGSGVVLLTDYIRKSGLANVAVGYGGTTITGNITLTALSAGSMVVTPATPGLYVTLPDATTCIKGAVMFAVFNAGDFDYGVKDSTGTQLGWIRAGTGATLGLSDSTTSAGIWSPVGLEKTGMTAYFSSATVSASYLRRVTLDATRDLFLLDSANLYAIVYDSSSQIWGAPTLVRSAITAGTAAGILSAANQVLVLSDNAAASFQAVTLTVSGTGITVNTGTAVAVTLAGNATAACTGLLAVSTSFVCSYFRSTITGAFRAITVSGTTPTIGAEAVVGPSGTQQLAAMFASGSVVRTFCSSTTLLYATPYTVSGSTLTVGTAITVPTTVQPYRAVQNGNGNIVCNYVNSTHFATVFKLTGTTEAASSISLGSAVPAGAQAYADYLAVSASKVVYGSMDTAGTAYFNILTDTAGTASAGTQVTFQTSGSGQAALAALLLSGTNARFQTVSVGGSLAYHSTLTLDCSGTGPALSSVSTTSVNSTAPWFSVPQSSDMYGVRNPRLLLTAATATYLGNGQDNRLDLRVTPTRSGTITGRFVQSIGSNLSVVGQSGNQAYLVCSFQGSGAGSGVVVQRLESAA